MSDFKHIEEQIAWLDSVIAVFTLDCEPRQNLVKARDTMQAMLDVVRAGAELTESMQALHAVADPNKSDALIMAERNDKLMRLYVALDKLKAEKVIDAAENGRACAEGHDFVSKGDGTAKCADCGELCDVSETSAARSGRADRAQDENGRGEK